MKRLVLLALALTAGLLLLPRPGASQPAGTGVIPGRYIVVLKGGESPEGVANEHGLQADHVYHNAVNGFAVAASDAQANKLRQDPRVEAVVPDREVTVSDPRPERVGGSGSGSQPAQVLPTGINRIDAEGGSTNSAIHIAIVDTGIQLNHPDLNVSSVGFSAFAGSPSDGNGHGTHVSGTAAALNNSIGVIGVAPGATLHAVKVLNNGGSGSTSTVVAGLDWVAANAAANGITVANMSLGGSSSGDTTCVKNLNGTWSATGTDTNGNPISDPMHAAICKVVNDAHVVVAVAAGNSSADASSFVPAAYPEVIAVGAVADYNGKGPGSVSASPTCNNYGPDDTLATFSNFGSRVDLMAPGVCILSTYKGSSYATLSGTSMSTPHVTGTVARYVAANGLPGGSAIGSTVASALVGAGWTKAQSDAACGYTDSLHSSTQPIVHIPSASTCN